MQSRALFGDDFLNPAESLLQIKPLLENPEIKKIGQNIKYDFIVLKNAGIEIKGIYFDTMIASYLLDSGERRHNLDDLAEQHLNYKTISFKELTGTGKNFIPITEIELDRLADYAIEDADIAFRLYKLFEPKLKEQNLDKLFFETEMKLVSVLADMELTGVKIDVHYFEQLSKENEAMLVEVENKIYQLAETKFNLNSTRELSSILFDKLGLKPVKKTKTGFSTDINVLETLKGRHKIIDYLISYRTLSKLKSTYIDALPKLINPRTKRIHTSFNQTVVATGRLSSSDPNLQNIPAKDDFGKKIRSGFVAEKGYFILSADYSQIELRLAAHLSEDANMIKAFNDGIDIHSMTASHVYKVPMDNVNSDMRRQAKIINFSTIYGVSPYGLSQQAGISVKEASEFIRIYFETYPGFKKYMEDTINFARQNGYVETVLGRKRRVADINAEAVFIREGAERIAINTPIQGTSADMIKIAMINIHDYLKTNNLKSKLVLQVHDELVLEVCESELNVVSEKVIEFMQKAIPLKIPVLVSLGFAANWAEAH
jgi:DNA polymerase-1